MNQRSNFLSVCEEIGAHTPLWVQGAGGNVSEKFSRADQMLLRIKASGYRLDQVTENRGFVDLNYKETKLKLEDLLSQAGSETLYAELLTKGVVARPILQDRASMETGFHLTIASPLVAHFHSLAGLLLADRYFKGDPRAITFASSMPLSYQFLDYVKPGLELSSAIQKAGHAEVYFLKNHGVILALRNSSELQEWIQIERGIIDAFAWGSLLESIEDTAEYWPLAALMPDTVVFMDKLLAILEEDPKRAGLFRLPANSSADESLRELWAANVRIIAAQPDVECIPSSQWESISGLPMEKYRQSMHALQEGF